MIIRFLLLGSWLHLSTVHGYWFHYLIAKLSIPQFLILLQTSTVQKCYFSLQTRIAVLEEKKKFSVATPTRSITNICSCNRTLAAVGKMKLFVFLPPLSVLQDSRPYVCQRVSEYAQIWTLVTGVDTHSSRKRKRYVYIVRLGYSNIQWLYSW